MTAVLLYVGGILLFFLVLHFVRERRSDLWRPSVPRPEACNSPQSAQNGQEETQPAPWTAGDEVTREYQEVVHR